MAENIDKLTKGPKRGDVKADERKARLAEALRANLRRRKEAGAKARMSEPQGQESET